MNCKVFALIVLTSFSVIIFSTNISESNLGIDPPIAPKRLQVSIQHGDSLNDNYLWMKDLSRSDPNVVEYIEAENRYADEVMKFCNDIEEEIFKEIVSREKETDFKVPVKIDSFYYYSRTEEGKQYSISCRKKDVLNLEEEILLDKNLLSTGKKYFRLTNETISPDHNLLAYKVDTSGNEKYTLYIKNIVAGTILPDTLQNVGSVVWSNDSKILFYVLRDPNSKIRKKIMRHVLGTSQDNDDLVYEEKEQGFGVWVSKTKSREFILFGTGSRVSSEVRFSKADDPYSDLKLIAEREENVKYSVKHHNENFYIITNEDALNNKVMKTIVNNPVKQNWQEFIAHRDSVYVGIQCFKDFFVVYEREKGIEKLKIIDLNTNKTHYIDFPEPIFSFGFGDNPNYFSHKLRFNYSSLITPYSVYDYDMRSEAKELLKQQEIVGGYNSSLYNSERVFATAADGVKIPVSLVYRKNLFAKDGTNPLYISSYGFYGNSNEPNFSFIRLSLLDRGFVVALPHI
jgi:oligopeptidase B